MAKKSRVEDDLFDPEKDIQRAKGFPQQNELVLARIRDTTRHGAYADLLEYNNLRAYIHISEISRTWVKNIRNHVRVGQRVVAKVLRVDHRRKQIDLSLKRVPEQMKKLKLLEAKRQQTAQKLFDMARKVVPREVLAEEREIRDIFVLNFNTLYDGFEYCAQHKIEDIKKLGISEEWAKELQKIAKENIVISTVDIRGTLEITIPGGNGVQFLKEALINGRDKVEEEAKDEITIEIYTEGSPHYAIEVIAQDYKEAEKALENSLERIQETVEDHDGTFSFERDD